MARLQKIVTAILSVAFIFGLLSSQIAALANQPQVHIDPPFADLRMSDLRDSFDEQHFGHRHEAIDIMEALGTPIRAVDDGTIRKLFLSAAGGTTIYQFNNAGSYCYYYAHLDHYVDGLREGQPVFRGQIVGYVAPAAMLPLTRRSFTSRSFDSTTIDAGGKAGRLIPIQYCWKH